MTETLVKSQVVPDDASPGRTVTLDDIPEVCGWNRKVFPTGWFQVAWSEEIAPGDVRPLKYFGKDLVLYRTEGGEPIVQSAFCPHMGAHLGHGGHVSGDRIVCPYHGWEWGCDGRNKLVPSDGVPSGSNRVLKNYATAESNGCIWMWHDALGREPMWPALREYRDDLDCLPIWPHATRMDTFRVQPQWVAENIVDIDHLLFVHQSKVIPVLHKDRSPIEYQVEGPIWRNIRQHPLQSSLTEGVGVQVIIVPQDPAQPQRLPSFLIAGITPIDHEHSHFRHTNLVPQDPDAEGSDGDVPVGRALRRINTMFEQGTRDIPIWQNMNYLNRPAYARSETVFRRFRQFCDQFYPEVPEEVKAKA